MNREQIKLLLLKQELTFAQFMERLKHAASISTDSGMADALGMSTGNYANRKRSGSIPFDIAIPFAISRSVSIDWLCRGTGPAFINEKEASPVPFVQLDSALFGQICFQIEKAFAGHQVDAVGSAAVARKFGILAALIYNKVAPEQDHARRLQLIQADAELLAGAERAAQPSTDAAGIPKKSGRRPRAATG